MPVAEEGRPATFSLLVVPGVTVDRWSHTWSERLPAVQLRVLPTDAAQAAALLPAGADAGILRLPVDRDVFDAIPLYTEATVVVVGQDHALAAADEVTLADLAGDTLLWPADDVLAWTDTEMRPTGTAAERPSGTAEMRPAGTAAERPATTVAAIELVAAGVGVLVVPMSLARAYHRRDLTYRVVTDAPTSSVALVWDRTRYTDLVEEMIGIVRGRTANSTRGRVQAPGTSADASPRKATSAEPSARKAASGRPAPRRGDRKPRPAPGRRRR